MTRNTLRAGLSADEPLPDLLVLAGGSEARPRTKICGRIRLAMAADHPIRAAAGGEGPQGKTLSDLDRHHLVKSIQDTLLNVSLSLSNKAVSKAMVATLERLMRDCDGLLNAPPSRHFDTRPTTCPRRRWRPSLMAAVEAALGNISKAKHLYEQAAHATTAWLAASSRALPGRRGVSRSSRGRDIHRALDRLRELLERVTKPSLEAAEVLTAGRALLAAPDGKTRRRCATSARRKRRCGPLGSRPLEAAYRQALLCPDVGRREHIPDGGVQHPCSNGLMKRIFGGLEKTYRGQGRFQDADRYLRHRGCGRHDPRRKPDRHRVHRRDDQEPDSIMSSAAFLARRCRGVSS